MPRQITPKVANVFKSLRLMWLIFTLLAYEAYLPIMPRVLSLEHILTYTLFLRYRGFILSLNLDLREIKLAKDLRQRVSGCLSIIGLL